MSLEPLIITNFAIQDLDGSNRTTYDLSNQDEINLTNEANDTLVSSGQSIKNWTESTLEAETYNLDILQDSRVGAYSDIGTKCTFVIVYKGGEIQLYGVRLNAKKIQDGTRERAMVSCTVSDKHGFYNNGIGIWTIEGTFEVT